VVYLDRKINELLSTFDPKALEQVDRALTEMEQSFPGLSIPAGRHAKYDFGMEWYGSITLLQPLTTAAHEWIENNLPSDVGWFGKSAAIESNYWPDIEFGIRFVGLTIGRI
jgi:hypothetical protein